MYVATQSNFSNGGTIAGGTGGSGGPFYGAVGDYGTAGNGGNGGTGVALAQDVGFTNSGTITGGTGGGGGPNEASGNGGAGGSGGVGVALSMGANITNQGTIRGGNGAFGEYDSGTGGVAVTLAQGASLTNQGIILGGSSASYNFGSIYYYNVGGTAIRASGNDTIINGGSIAGGPGDGLLNAINLSGGQQHLGALFLLPDFRSVVSTTGNAIGGDTLELGGGTNGIFDASTIGSQYQGFAYYAKVGGQHLDANQHNLGGVSLDDLARHPLDLVRWQPRRRRRHADSKRWRVTNQRSERIHEQPRPHRHQHGDSGSFYQHHSHLRRGDFWRNADDWRRHE